MFVSALIGSLAKPARIRTKPKARNRRIHANVLCLILFCRFFFRIRRPREPEPKDEAFASRDVGEAIGTANVSRRVEPAAAPNHPVITATSIYRVIMLVLAIGSLTVYILTPLVDITAHVIYVESIR